VCAAGPASGLFAAGLIYGQVKKTYQRRELVRLSQVMRCGTHAALRTALIGLRLSGRVNTAFVEWINLTLRQSVAALVRCTWATMQDAPQLLLHLEWWRADYHFVRPHESLRVRLGQPCAHGGKRVPQRKKAANAGPGGRADEEAMDGAWSQKRTTAYHANCDS